MSVKLNKTAMIDEYINNNIEMLINSNKSLEELCEDFNKNNDKKVSFSSFYKSFKQISKDKGLTKQRTRKSKHQRMLNEVKNDNKNDSTVRMLERSENNDNNNEKKGLKPVPPEEAKRLLPDSDEEEEETPMQKMLHSYKEDNIDKLRHCEHNRIYGVERHLNNYEAQTFEISKYFPSYYSGYRFIIDTDKWFRVNSQLYAPIVLILSETNIYTNEEYNATFKTSHPKNHNNYTNVVRIPNQDYKYKYYVVYDDGDERTYEPFAKTDFSECDDILQLLEYERYEDLPEEEWDNNNKAKTNKAITEEEAAEMLDDEP